MRIEASRELSALPAAVFAFLSDLENHWKLTGRWVEAVALDHSNGTVRIHGPLGLRRTARTIVVDAEPDRVMHGTAVLSGGTVARIAWELGEAPRGSSVRLSAEIDQAALPDRALLALGGRAWMKRRFQAILARLEEQVAG